MIVTNSETYPQDFKMPPKSDRGQDIDTLPPPPPYSPPQAGLSNASLPVPHNVTSSTPSSPVVRLQDPQTVNYIELFSKHDSIAGTYLVDPLLPSMSGVSKKLNRRRAKVWGKCNRNLDNAVFRTRHGHINLDMAIVSRDPTRSSFTTTAKVPARVLLSSRHGRININMHEIQPGRSLDLQIETRHGRIVLLLPPTFDGPLVFNTRSRGAVSFLPAFAARTRTIRASDCETVVFCAAPGAEGRCPMKPINQMADDDGDRCLVRSRHGRVVVGISGLDRVEEQETSGGLFRTLGRVFEVHGRALGKMVEVQGRLLGQYAETRARMLEKTFM